MRQTSRIVVVDSVLGGDAKPLRHGLYSIVYLPSWIRLRFKFKWDTTSNVLHTLSVMKEYFNGAEFMERPFRAQRCLYTLKALHIYGYDKQSLPRYSEVAREHLSKLMKELSNYLAINPVVAWDWIASWTECRAMAEAYPVEYVRLFRRLRSHLDSKRKPKPELTYFINILEVVAEEHNIDLERKWN